MRTRIYPDQARRLINAFLLVLAVLGLAIGLNLLQQTNPNWKLNKVLGAFIDCTDQNAVDECAEDRD